MSNLTYEEMSKMMKPGVRVVRGKDWTDRAGAQDGNGPGTVLSEDPQHKNYWKVKWDNNFENLYLMGTSPYTGYKSYILKIIEIHTPKLRLGAQSVTLLSTLRDPTQLRRRP